MLVIGDRREDFDDLARLVTRYDDRARIRRANGAEDIRLDGGGGIRFLTIRQAIHFGGARGHMADHLHLPMSTLGDARLIGEVSPCLATRLHSTITFYSDRR